MIHSKASVTAEKILGEDLNPNRPGLIEIHFSVSVDAEQMSVGRMDRDMTVYALNIELC